MTQIPLWSGKKIIQPGIVKDNIHQTIKELILLRLQKSREHSLVEMSPKKERRPSDLPAIDPEQKIQGQVIPRERYRRHQWHYKVRKTRMSITCLWKTWIGMEGNSSCTEDVAMIFWRRRQGQGGPMWLAIPRKTQGWRYLLLFLCYLCCVCVIYTHMDIHIIWHMSGSERKTRWNWFFPSTTWVPGIKERSSGLVTRTLILTH